MSENLFEVWEHTHDVAQVSLLFHQNQQLD